MYEAMFRVIKESENVDERQHCFLIQSFGKESHYFSVETRQVTPDIPPYSGQIRGIQSHIWYIADCSHYEEMDTLQRQR